MSRLLPSVATGRMRPNTIGHDPQIVGHHPNPNSSRIIAIHPYVAGDQPALARYRNI